MKNRKLTVDSVAKENLDDVIVIKMNSLDQQSKKQKIKLFKKNGEVLVANEVDEYGVIEELKKALPFINEIKAESIFDGVIAPNGWHYVNVGDNLFISDEIFETFKKELEDVKSPIEAMNVWKHRLEKIIREMNRPKVKNGLTEIVFILDRSGSMGGFEKDVVGGFNATIAKQKLEPGRAIVSTVLFDHETEIVHDRVPLENVKEMTDKDYECSAEGIEMNYKMLSKAISCARSNVDLSNGSWKDEDKK